MLYLADPDSYAIDAPKWNTHGPKALESTWVFNGLEAKPRRQDRDYLEDIPLSVLQHPPVNGHLTLPPYESDALHLQQHQTDSDGSVSPGLGLFRAAVRTIINKQKGKALEDAWYYATLAFKHKDFIELGSNKKFHDLATFKLKEGAVLCREWSFGPQDQAQYATLRKRISENDIAVCESLVDLKFRGRQWHR